LAIKERYILTTLTESDSIITFNNAKDCPFLLECNTGVTNNFYQRICNTNNYNNCHHYARRMDILMTPMVWLQKKAVQDNKKDISLFSNLSLHKNKK